MRTIKFKAILISGLITLSLYCCKTEEKIFHGEITGTVIDSLTREPIGAASVKLSQSNDTIQTESDGTYLMKNIIPGEYEIKASKLSYVAGKRNVTVLPEETTTKVNFALTGVPLLKYSVSYLDFGSDSTELSFTISNIGKGKLTYTLAASQDWIAVYPASGDITSETDSIKVAINKDGLVEGNIYKENIKIISDIGVDTIKVFLNGVIDHDLNYYRVVTIGTQTWMAENLNVGNFIPLSQSQVNNGVIEKYCYDNKTSNCDIYGGLYQWDEMMQYHPIDSGVTGTTQGLCPIGWHLPTKNEWLVLIDYLGGMLISDYQDYQIYSIVGGMLKETGTKHWLTPNFGATDETGFSALPGGTGIHQSSLFSNLGTGGSWGSSEHFLFNLSYDTDSSEGSANGKESSIRCIKNPGKR